MDISTDAKQEALSLIEAGILMRVQFKRAPLMAYITAHACTNPHCPCKSVTLNFFDANGQLNDRLFELVVDYEIWQLESSKVFKDDLDYTELVDEFMGSLDEQIKAEILSLIKIKAPKEHALRDDIDLSGYDIDKMVYYSEIYRTEPYEELLFELDGKEYLVIDHYCPKPKCNCKDVMLAFYLLDEAVPEHKPILSYRVKFDTGRRAVEEKNADVSLRLVKDLYDRLSKLLGGSPLDFFENRYRKIKEWGAVYFGAKNAQAKVASQKIARNAPCPCGSGKKYKRCCGVE